MALPAVHADPAAGGRDLVQRPSGETFLVGFPRKRHSHQVISLSGDDAGAEAVRRAGPEPVAAAAVRRLLAQRDPTL